MPAHGIVATAIAVRLTPNPPAVRTLLLDFTSVEAAAATVSGIIAAGLVPAALEMMDQRITQAVEAYVGAGYPTDAAAVLLVEVDGLDGGVAAATAIVARVLFVLVDVVAGLVAAPFAGRPREGASVGPVPRSTSGHGDHR